METAAYIVIVIVKVLEHPCLGVMKWLMIFPPAGGAICAVPGLNIRLNTGLRIRSDPVFLPGSGFQISLDPDPVSVQILEQKKIAESSLKVIYQKKT